MRLVTNITSRYGLPDQFASTALRPQRSAASPRL
ncbi:unnamed protein product, partial [Linum tenue]